LLVFPKILAKKNDQTAISDKNNVKTDSNQSSRSNSLANGKMPKRQSSYAATSMNDVVFDLSTNDANKSGDASESTSSIQQLNNSGSKINESSDQNQKQSKEKLVNNRKSWLNVSVGV
jgi:hypothetical protein